MNNHEEAFIISRLKEGDMRALEIIFKKYYGNLCRYLKLLFKNEIMVDHIAQDIFTYIWENREEIVITNSLESYIYTAGRYKAINELRNARRRASIQQEIATESSKVADANTELELSEMQLMIDNAIKTLPERCQKIFKLSREEEMSYKEIAEFLNISVNTVEGQMSIALKKLRTILRPLYFQILLSL